MEPRAGLASAADWTVWQSAVIASGTIQPMSWLFSAAQRGLRVLTLRGLVGRYSPKLEILAAWLTRSRAWCKSCFPERNQAEPCRCLHSGRFFKTALGRASAAVRVMRCTLAGLKLVWPPARLGSGCGLLATCFDLAMRRQWTRARQALDQSEFLSRPAISRSPPAPACRKSAVRCDRAECEPWSARGSKTPRA